MRKKSAAKEKVVCRGQFLEFIHCGDWEYYHRINCTDIVIIVAMTHEQEVIFVEQYRPPLKKNCIEFPAGLINDKKRKESFIAGTRRELLEETGYTARSFVHLLKGPVSSGSCKDLITMVMARGLKKVAHGGGDEEEDIKIHEVPWSGVDTWLDKMKRRGFLIEPKIYAGLYFLAKYNNLSI